MAKYIRPEEIGKYLRKLQGDRTDTQFALDTGIGRPILHRLRKGLYLPSRAVLAKLNLEFAYREKEKVLVQATVPAKAKKK